MPLKLHVVIHGAGPAFMRQPGCPCVRCAEPVIPATPTQQDFIDLLAWSRQAHTAASLVIERDGLAVDHTLVDCGMGVMQNLAALPTPARDQPITRVLLTHGHLDHVAGLDGLVHTLQMARTAGDFTADEQPWPLPVWSTRRTWANLTANAADQPTASGIMRGVAGEIRHHDLTEAALRLDEIPLHPALTVTPIPVEHYQDSVNYLFTFWPAGQVGDGDPVRVALCWDLLAFPAHRKGEVWQQTDLHPQADPLLSMLRGVDFLAVEMTTWRPAPMGHISFEGGITKKTREPTGYGVRDLLAWWQPKHARIVHYSGWDDRKLSDGTWQSGEAAAHNVNPATGPVSDKHLRRALRAALGAEHDVDIAHAGNVFTFG